VALIVALAANLILVSVALRPIRDLEKAAVRVWAGDLESRVPRSVVADPELAQVGGTLNYLLTALSDDRARVRALASAVVRTSDRERSRVGKELHDSIAQSIAALRYELIAIERDADPDIVRRIEAVRLSAGELLEHVRLLSHTVHPQILDDLGLIPALRHLARTTTGGPTVTISATGDVEAALRDIPADVAAAMYHVAQECIANARRHASAQAIDVSLGIADGVATMRVADDGVGFDVRDAEQKGTTMGLFIMRERIALLNGRMEIESVPTQGSAVSVWIPIVSAAQPPVAVEPMRLERHHAR
jgi:signal transduction histidine kinase